MIRRIVSVALFALGGWMLSCEIMLAFFNLGQGIGTAISLALFLALAAPFLLLGTWASPGERWREMGLTILITSGLGMFMILTLAMVLADPTMKEFMPPRPKELQFAPVQGAVNLLVLAGLGWLHYRTGRKASA